MAGRPFDLDRKEERKYYHVALVAILALALALRIAWLLVTPNVPATDFGGYLHLGQRLITGETNWKLPGFFYWTPGYPYFLFVVFKIFGPTLTIARIANLVLATLTVYVVYLLAARFFSRKIALVAALLYSIFPTAIYFTALTGTETLFTFLLLAAIYSWLLVEQKGNWWIAIAGGVIFGFAGLTRSQGLVVLAALLPLVLVRRRDLFFKWTAMALIAFIIVLPWMMRTKELYGTFNMQANGGVFLWQGNHEGAPLPAGAFPWEATYVPYKTISGEFYAKHPKEASEWAFQKVIEFFKTKPLLALRGIAIKAQRFTIDQPDGIHWNQVDDFSKSGVVIFHAVDIGGRDWANEFHAAEIVFYWILVYPALVGVALVLMLKRGRFLLIPWGVWLGIHALTIGMVRYRFPLYPYLAIFSAFTLVIIVDSIRTLVSKGLQSPK